MSLAYDEYLAEHIGNVNKGLHWMLDNLGLSQEEKNAIETAMVSFNHDESKYSSEEYNAYDQYFYGGNRSYKVVQDFNYAWLHHIHQNPHHWQYWVLLEDDPEAGLPYKTLPIPLPYIFEMIADWWSFSWKSGNLFEIFNWYAEHRDKQYINLSSRMILERILEKIWDVLIMQEAVAGHDIYEIEGQYRRFWIEQKMDQLNLEHSSPQVIGKVTDIHETENGLEVTVEHSESEDDEDLYGVPELKKFPMPDKKHVKSAIRFFNYVDPKYEKELAEAIIEKAEEFGLDLKKDITIGDENMFKKYIVADDDENKNEDRVLTHYGIKGQTWGERRFQYADGSLTPEGRKRYLKDEKMDPSNKKGDKKSDPLFDISKLGQGTYTPPGAPGPDGRVGSVTGAKEPEYDQWEKDLYAEFEKNGTNPANMSDAEFKALLVKKGVLKEDAADSLVATMKQKAIKNYKIYSKKDEPEKTETTTAATNSDSDKKSKKGSGASESSGSSGGKASGGSSGSGAKQAQANDISAVKTNEKPSVDSLEKNIVSKIEKLSKLKEGAINLGDILSDDMDGFIAKLSDLIDDDISGLSYKDLKELRERLQKQYEDSKKDKESDEKSEENEEDKAEDEEKKEK